MPGYLDITVEVYAFNQNYPADTANTTKYHRRVTRTDDVTITSPISMDFQIFGVILYCNALMVNDSCTVTIGIKTGDANSQAFQINALNSGGYISGPGGILEG
jgi:hypothetical protein